MAPFSPLIANGADLRALCDSDALRERLAAVYGVAPDCLLVTPGRVTALDIICRALAAQGVGDVAGDECAAWTAAARASGLASYKEARADCGGVYKASPGAREEGVLTAEAIDRLMADFPAALIVVDETYIAFSAGQSLAPAATLLDRLVVVRDLGAEYGLMGAPCAALIAQPALLERWRGLAALAPLATPVIRAALSALDAHKAVAYTRRRQEIVSERQRLAQTLAGSPMLVSARAGDGPFVFVSPCDGDAAAAALKRYGVECADTGAGRLRIDIREPRENDAVLSALDVDDNRLTRVGEVVRETAETKIVARVELDRCEPGAIATGVAFFDHMLTQVAAHGGFALDLTCAGDTEVDPHHTIEDCALALGQALSRALGERRGIARFGFMLPMDEAEAKISIDLGGRPYLVFEGAFTATHLGQYPTEMTEHVFRSLAQTLGAAIHVAVRGANDHHKTEACYKAFGRALRQAVRIESDALPSTKGTLA